MNTIVIEARQCPNCGRLMAGGPLAGLCPACLLAQGTAEGAPQPGAGKVPFEPPPIDEIRKLFPQLEIDSLLGAGGMGAVYKARQPVLDRWVALKVLPAENSSGVNFAERFNREARALARLSHPNIVSVHEFGQAGALHFFIMEFVDGTNLRQLLAHRRLSSREALQIIPQICDALQYAHDEGVVHRDIKPENVLVDRKGRVKIADFGLAKILNTNTESQRLTLEGQVMGTPHYMAPEQVEKPLAVDHRADIYALGVVFYEMLTGDLPLGKFAPPSRKVQIDLRFDDVVLRALENDPERRYQQASEVKSQVESIAAAPGASSAPKSEEPVKALTKQQARFVGLGALVAAAAGFLMLVVTLGISGRTHPSAVLLSALGAGAVIFWAVREQRKIPRAEPTSSAADQTLTWREFIGGTMASVLIVFGLLTIAFGFVSAVTGRSLMGWLGIIGWQSVIARFLIAAVIVGYLIRSRSNGRLTLEGTAILTTKRPRWLRRNAILASIALLLITWTAFRELGSKGQTRDADGVLRTDIKVSKVAKRDSQTGTLTAQLPGGGVVELLGVGETNAALNGWWSADGKPVRDAEYDVPHPVEYQESGRVSRDFLIRVRDLPNGASHAGLNTEPSSGIGSGALVYRDGKLLFGATQARGAWRPSVRKADLQAGYALDPWRTIARLSKPNWNSSQTRKHGDPFWRIDFHDRPKETSEGAQVALIIGPETRMWVYQVVAVDTNGVEHTANSARGTPVDKVTLWTYTFEKLRLNQVTEFRVQARPVYWVEFRNVALAPREKLPEPRRYVFAAPAEISITNGFDFDFDAKASEPLPPALWETEGYRRNAHLAKHGADASVWEGALRPADMEFVQLSDEEWETLGVDELRRRVYGNWYHPSIVKPEGTRTFGFRTRELGVGILQFVTNDTKGAVELRYKMLRRSGSESNAAPNQPAAADSSTLRESPPVVVETFPAAGAFDVAPGQRELRVRFSKEMTDESWSWSTAWEGSAPELVDTPRYDADRKTCLVTAMLEPGRTYAFWLNSENFQNFKDVGGRPAIPYLLVFKTKSDKP